MTAQASSTNIGATIGMFMRAANVVSKQVLTDVKIWAFQKSLVKASENHSNKNATLDRLEMSLTDVNERSAIAWFDSETLINAQLGGKYRVWKCAPADEQPFRLAQTNAFDTFNSNKKPLSSAKAQLLDQLFEDIQSEVNKELDEERLSDTYISDTFKQGIKSLATPFTFGDHVILILAGESTPELDRQRGLNLMESTGETASVVRQMFSLAKRLEIPSSEQVQSLQDEEEQAPQHEQDQDDTALKIRAGDPILCWANICY